MMDREQVLAILQDVPLTMRYRLTDAGWWIAHCAEFPEAQTQGETKEEVRENLMDAVGFILEDYSESELYEIRDSLLAEESEALAL